MFGDGIDISIRGPERIALTGPNGAGKSTLLRIISGELEPDAGTVQRADGRIAYLSQRLDLLDPDRTVLENLVAYAPSLSETRRMHLLAQFLFRGNRIHLPVRRCPAVSGCAPRSRACCTPSRHRSCCCSTSRPTTSISSASRSWSPR